MQDIIEKELFSLEKIVGGYSFIIPIYQRPYEWKEEVRVLLEDLADTAVEGKEYFMGTLVGVKRGQKNGKEIFEVVDGQQRLISLYLLVSYLRNYPYKSCENENYSGNICEGFGIEYEIRESTNKILKNITQEERKEEFSQGLGEIKGFFENKENKKLICKFVDLNKLCSNLYFAFIYLPKDTDVAKYFEDMNSRGEQLEKHEIIKAKLLELLNSDNNNEKEGKEKEEKEKEKALLSHLWDLSSFMGAHIEDLIYYESRSHKNEKDNEDKIKTSYSEIRERLLKFVSNNESSNDPEDHSIPLEIEKLFSNLISKEGGPSERSSDCTLQTLLKEGCSKTNENEKGFYIPPKKEVRSIVPFPIFLLHVLKLFVLFKSKGGKCNKCSDAVEELNLDDKKLVEEFKKCGLKVKVKVITEETGSTCELFDKNKPNAGNNAKEFILFLFAMRILFDYFIFKREVLADKPVLKVLEKEENEGGEETVKFREDNEFDSILMIQLLFNYTSFHRTRQEWVSVALWWLFNNVGKIMSDNSKAFYDGYLNFLEEFDRRIALWRIEQYDEGGNNESLIDQIMEEMQLDPNQIKITNYLNNRCYLEPILNNGVGTPHYWFYRLEYLLWKRYIRDRGNNNEIKNFLLNLGFANNELKKAQEALGEYRLTNLNSIEHVFPQTAPDNVNDNQEYWQGESSKHQRELFCCRCSEETCYKDCFGNLALVSDHMNSACGNKLPDKKKNLFEYQVKNGTLESLKLLLIYEFYFDKSTNKWTPTACCKHHKNMVEMLASDLVRKSV